MEKNMQENFDQLDNRVSEALYNTDLEKINHILERINGPTLVSGVGGSSVVALFASKILYSKNHIITQCIEPRDFKYIDLCLYNNVLSCSYSGNNYGVELSFSNKLKKYLLASKEYEGVINLKYNCINQEQSFISLASTLIPCSILLNYYIGNHKERIIDYYLFTEGFDFNPECEVYEIFSGIETSVASKYLESTMVESGIGIPIIHDKYSYCHGRSTLSTTKNSIAIYFNLDTELDILMLEELPKYYKQIVILNTNPSIISEYKLLYQCMYLTKYIAEYKNKDLSGVDYSPIVKKLYKYHGEL